MQVQACSRKRGGGGIGEYGREGERQSATRVNSEGEGHERDTRETTTIRVGPLFLVLLLVPD